MVNTLLYACFYGCGVPLRLKNKASVLANVICRDGWCMQEGEMKTQKVSGRQGLAKATLRS
jgi:hypothetical protein